MNIFEPVHIHFLLKATVGNVHITEEEGKRFLTTLVHAIGMVPVTEPQCVQVTHPGNEGPTGSINLATSHIAFHLWEGTGLLMLDVYSCKHFEVETVIQEVNKMFSLINAYYMTIDRLTFEQIRTCDTKNDGET